MKKRKDQKPVQIFPDTHSKVKAIASEIGLPINKTIRLAVDMLGDRLKETKEDGRPLIIYDQESYIRNAMGLKSMADGVVVRRVKRGRLSDTRRYFREHEVEQ
jgi:hypothetical protein